MLELSFQTRDVRTACEDDTEAQRRFGSAAAAALRHRIEDLRAASTVFDMLVGGLRVDAICVHGGTYQLDLEDGWVIRFRANHAVPPIDADGMVDWTRVHRIQIIDITRG